MSKKHTPSKFRTLKPALAISINLNVKTRISVNWPRFPVIIQSVTLTLFPALLKMPLCVKKMLISKGI